MFTMILVKLIGILHLYTVLSKLGAYLTPVLFSLFSPLLMHISLYIDESLMPYPQVRNIGSKDLLIHSFVLSCSFVWN